MRIVDVATSIDRNALVPLSTVKALYRWSDRNQRIFERFFKLRSVCLHLQIDLATVLVGCLKQLVAAHPELVGGVDFVVYSHCLHSTVPVDYVFLANITAQVLDCRPETFSVTQGSSASGILSVKLLQSLTSVSKPTRAILLTGEKCFHSLVQYQDHNGINGEAGTAVYFTTYPTDSSVAVASVATRTMTDMSTRVVATDIEMRNHYDHFFIPTMVATIQAALDEAGVPAQQIGTILPYHVSPYTFDRLARAIGLSPDVVVRTNLYDVGHCFTGDPFINLSSWLKSEDRNSKSYLLALSAGIAGTFAAMILKQENGNAYCSE